MHYEGEKSLNIIMEKLRLKATQYKSWSDNAKSMRVALMDKRQVLDTAERQTLQKCLDCLQKSIKVTTLQSMVERLESITRQQGLMFTSGPSGTDCFISSDMFYVEVLLELTGDVKDVKIAHQGEPDLVSCPLLSEILRDGKFKEFTNHLEGLVSIYQLNADKKQKSKAYLALKALETDLNMLSELQSTINEPNNFVHRSPVGILQTRIGGQAMKLTYFISPYDLLDTEAKLSIPLTVETVKGRGLGHYVTVGIESSTAHKLQTMSLMTISKSDGKSLPQFAALSNLNSTTLPACFALQLPKPIPMSVNLIKKIQAVTGIACADLSKVQPMLSLITQQASDGQLDCNNNKGMFVTLPDQHHCYFLNSGSELKGVLVSSIPFVHPTHVPQILVFLRQQTLFNELIGSCIRTCSKQDLEIAHTFEIIALSWLHISISFEHPSDESMATADLDLSDVTNCKCKLYSLSSDNICSDEYASKVLQRCLSIPIMMRAILRKAQALQKKNASSGTDPFYNAVSAGMNSSTRPRIFGSSNGGSDALNGKFGFHSSIDGKSGGKMSEEMEYVSQTIDSTSDVYCQNNTAATLSRAYDRAASLLSPTNTPYSTQSGTTTADSLSSSESPQLNNNNVVPPNTMASQIKAEQKGGMLMNMLNDTAQNQPVTMLLPKIRTQRKRKNNDGVVAKSPVGRSPKRKFNDDDLRDMRTPTPTSTPDHMSSGSTSPGGPYDTSPSFFPIKSSPSTESPSYNNRLTSPLETLIKTEPPDQSPVRRCISVESGQMSESSSKLNENSSSPDLFVGQTNKDHYEFTPADCAEPSLAGYRAETSSVESDAPNVSFSSRESEKPKEKKVKKIKIESSSATSDLKMIDIQCSVAEQVAKLHGDPISPPSATQASTSIKISTKDGVKISTKLSDSLKKQGKRSSSAGVDAESRRKSEARKEKKRKRAESADALEHKTSIKLLPLPSGSRVSDKKSGDLARPTSHGLKPSTPMSGSGSSQSKASLTTTIKKSPAHSNSTTPPKNVSILKHSQNNKNNQKASASRQLSSSKPGVTTGEAVGKSAVGKSLKFHSSNKTEKLSSEKLKLKQLSIPSSTTITAIASGKSASPSTAQTVTIVPSPSDDPLKSPCISITTPPSMSITPIGMSASPPSPTGSNNKFFPTASTGSSGVNSKSGSSSNGNGNNKSPLKSRKSSLSAVIDKLMVNASVTQPPGEVVKGEVAEKKKESGKSIESRKYNMDSKGSDNKAEFTVKQSSQGIKLTVTKTRMTSDASNKVSKNKTGTKSSSWTSSTSSGNPMKSSSKSMSSSTSMTTSSTISQTTSKKHSSISSSNSSKVIPKSGSSSFKMTMASSSSAKVLVSSGKSTLVKSYGDAKSVNVNDLGSKTKIEDKVKTSKTEVKNDKKEKQADSFSIAQKVGESESEKTFQLLLAQSKASSHFNVANAFKPSEPLNTISTSAVDAASSNSKTVPTTTPAEESRTLGKTPSTSPNYSPVDFPVNTLTTKQNETPTLPTNMEKDKPLNKTIQSSVSAPSKGFDTAVDLSKPSSQPTMIAKPKKKFVGTPKSDDDEDELVIDCPGTPRKQKVSFEENAVISVGMAENSNPSNNMECKSRLDNSKFSPPQPSPVPKSPVNTPHSEVLSNPNSVSRPSPCVIDDDLMDEALMLGQ